MNRERSYAFRGSFLLKLLLNLPIGLRLLDRFAVFDEMFLIHFNKRIH